MADSAAAVRRGRPKRPIRPSRHVMPVIEAEYRTPILHHCCLETHSAVADYTGGDNATPLRLHARGRLHRHRGATRVEACRSPAFAAQHGRRIWLQRRRDRCVARPMGLPAGQGSFKTPVKMVFTRRQEFLSPPATGRAPFQRARIGREGRHAGRPQQPRNIPFPESAAAASADSPYQYFGAGTVYRQSVSLTTHEDGSVPLRAPGNPQASFAMESLMDELAYKIGMDPIDFRKKNLPNTPNRDGSPNADAVAWSRPTRRRRQGHRLGKSQQDARSTQGSFGPRHGMRCIGAWAGGGRGGCVVTVDIGKDGSVTVSNSSQDLGTGTRTFVRCHRLRGTWPRHEPGRRTHRQHHLRHGRRLRRLDHRRFARPRLQSDAGYQARIAFAKIIAARCWRTDPDGVWFDKGYDLGGGKAAPPGSQACAALPDTGLSVRGQWQQVLASRPGAWGVFCRSRSGYRDRLCARHQRCATCRMAG